MEGQLLQQWPVRGERERDWGGGGVSPRMWDRDCEDWTLPRVQEGGGGRRERKQRGCSVGSQVTHLPPPPPLLQPHCPLSP